MRGILNILKLNQTFPKIDCWDVFLMISQPRQNDQVGSLVTILFRTPPTISFRKQETSQVSVGDPRYQDCNSNLSSNYLDLVNLDLKYRNLFEIFSASAQIFIWKNTLRNLQAWHLFYYLQRTVWAWSSPVQCCWAEMVVLYRAPGEDSQWGRRANRLNRE